MFTYNMRALLDESSIVMNYDAEEKLNRIFVKFEQDQIDLLENSNPEWDGWVEIEFCNVPQFLSMFTTQDREKQTSDAMTLLQLVRHESDHKGILVGYDKDVTVSAGLPFGERTTCHLSFGRPEPE